MMNWSQAALCCTFANMMIASRGGEKRFEVKEFLLTFGKKVEGVEDKKSSVLSNSQRMKALAREMTAFANADAKKKTRKRR